MNRGLLFWIIMLLLILFSFWSPFPSHIPISSIVLWVLLALLGWDVYGPALRGK